MFEGPHASLAANGAATLSRLGSSPPCQMTPVPSSSLSLLPGRTSLLHNLIPSTSNLGTPTDEQPQGPMMTRRTALEMATELLAEIIQNELPIYLIYIPERRIVGRAFVKKTVHSIIEQEVDKNFYWESQSEDIERAIRREVAYAILSHRWLDEGEPTFLDDMSFLQAAQLPNDWMHPDLEPAGCSGPPEPLQTENTADRIGHLQVTSGLAGRKKLWMFCKRVEELKESACQWAWADTCCIDKRSSAELDESIRSMYRWYKNAQICLVHLADTRIQRNDPTRFHQLENDSWFTRGWTLQELLAPTRIKFYDADWKPLTDDENDKAFVTADNHIKGEATVVDEPEEESLKSETQHPNPSPPIHAFLRSLSISVSPNDPYTPPHNAANDRTVLKSHHTLLDKVAKITGIEKIHLQRFKASITMVREKMRWASRRRTTRVEDTAYSLMALFDIDMPIAYGEGERAFFRLQKAIAEQTPWVDMLVWRGPRSRYHSMFAKSPQCFTDVEYWWDDRLYRHIHDQRWLSSQYAAHRLAQLILHRGTPSLVMTNGRLSIHLVIYNVASKTRKGERMGRPTWELRIKDLDSEPFSPITVVSDQLQRSIQGSLKMAVLDFELEDARGEPDAFVEFLYTDSGWRRALPNDETEAIDLVYRARMERQYVAILLSQAIGGEEKTFSRLETQDIILVKRPVVGWKRPQPVLVV